ncbi:hypothetical protein G9A89_010268 [Geosiphon pyriformis]|nr:hypothetical protein G9A89_010268 [Geosiphon pyriformis]
MEMATLLAREKGIDVNSDLKRQRVHSDQAVAEHLAAKWSFLIEKDSVDWFRVLLFTLPVKMTAYDLGTLLESISEKTCIINYSLDFGNRICCAVVGFESKDAIKSAYCTELIFSGVKLSWARLDLVHCEKCGFLGHSALECDALSLLITKLLKIAKRVTSENCHLQLAKLYTKKSVLISRPAVFGDKSWTQVVLLVSLSGDLYFNSGARSDSFSSGFSVSDIMCRLNGVKLVLLVLIIQVVPLSTPVPTLASPDTDMVLDVPWPSLSPSSSVLEDKMTDLSLSSSKVLTSKVGGFYWLDLGKVRSVVHKFRFFDALFTSISELIWRVAMCNIRSMINLDKQEDIIFTSGLDVGFHDAGVAIIMNNSLARHVLKVDEVPGYLISVCLLFKNKLSVTILVASINSMVFKAVNSSSFVVLGGDFNENESSKSASFKFCLGLNLVNTFDGHSLTKASTWSNSKGVEKVIDFILVNRNLTSVMALHFVNNVSEFFDTDYKSVSILIGLSGLLDTHLISICKQANQDWWKFKLKDADDVQWLSFKDCFSAKFLARSNMFKETRAIVQTADTVFSRIWYSKYDCSRNKQSSKFFKLELLIAKVVKYWNIGDLLNFNCLIKIWLAVDAVKASKVDSMVLNDVSSMKLIKHLLVIKKRYHKSKYYEFKVAEDIMLLDHLVVDDELVVEPNKVKLKVDKIMEE